MLKNKTTKKIVGKNVKVLEKDFEIAAGLMFRKKLQEGEVWYFKLPKTRRWDVHMFFVFQRLDLIFCADNKIVDLKESIKPFQLYLCKNECNTLIEAPPGTIKRTKSKVGDLTQYLKNSEGKKK